MLEHLEDLRSDFSAIHRVDDMYALDGPTFMQLAYRMPMYPGVMQARLRLQDMERQHQATRPVHPGQASTVAAGELTPAEVEALRNQARIRANPRALAPGEQPQYVPVDQLTRL